MELHYFIIAVAMGILMITVFPIICLLDEELIVCQSLGGSCYLATKLTLTQFGVCVSKYVPVDGIYYEAGMSKVFYSLTESFSNMMSQLSGSN